MTRALHVVAVLTVAALAGCGAPAGVAIHDVETPDPPAAATAEILRPVPPPPCQDSNDKSVIPGSLPPFDAQPQPPAMPPGILTDIVNTGSLTVGVDQNTLGFGWRNGHGDLEGFDIELAGAIGRAMFGEDGHVILLPVISSQRELAIEHDDVDLVISVMSITCARATKVAFSAAYFTAGQGVLVPTDSDIGSPDDLAGLKVCATNGSTSLENLAQVVPEAVPVGVPARTDCLVALQQGEVDAISTDDTILRGFMAQDPTLRLLDERISVEEYGIAIAIENEDLVRFVNGVLEDMIADGRWAELLGDAEVDLGDLAFPSDQPPTPIYAEDP